MSKLLKIAGAIASRIVNMRMERKTKPHRQARSIYLLLLTERDSQMANPGNVTL